MANNSALKLVVDTSEYDANIKKAAEGIQHLAKRVHDAGGFFDYFDKATMDFVKGLEDMSTAAVTSAGQYRELENAYKGLAATYNGLDPFEKQGEAGRELANQLGILKDRVLEAKANFEDASKSLEMPKIESTKSQLRDLTKELTDITVAYRALSDEERQSPIGQEMAQKIQQMTEKAGVMRDAMADVQASITNAASDTRVFDQIAGGAQMMTAGFQSAVGAMKLFGVETDNNVEVLAQLQAAMGLVNGLQTIQNALQKQSAVMQGVQAVQAAAAAAAQTSLAGATGAATVAQKAFNMVANANPYVLLATAVAAVGTAIYAFASASSKAKQEAEKMAKAEEEAAKKSEDARNAFVNAAAEAMNSASRLSSLQVAYKNANSEIEKTNILKQAQAEFKKLGIECKGVHDAQTLLISKGSDVIELIKTQGTVAALAAIRMEKFKESFKMLMENGYSASAAASLAGYNKDVQELDGQITNMQSRIQGLKGGLGIGKSGGGSKSTKSAASTEKDEMSLNSQKITDLTNEYIKATDERRQAIEKEIATLQKRNAEIQKLKDMALGKSFDGGTLNGEVVVTGSKMTSINKTFRDAPVNFDSINTYISGIKDQLKNSNLGDEMYKSLTEKLKDATTMSTLLQEMMERGLAGADLETTAQALKEKLLSPEGIDQTAIQSFIDELNKQIEEAGGVGMKLNADTGEVTDNKGKDKGGDGLEDMKKFNDGIGKLSGGLSQVTGGLKAIGVEVPKEVDQVIGVINGVSQIISGVSSIISVFQVSAITANTIALGALTSAVTANTFAKFIPFFANGGIVPHAANGYFVGGNSFSGDNTPIMANAGELILNKAAQGNLASMLEGNGLQSLQLATVISAEEIRFVLRNNGRRTGRGEYITSRNSRS